MTTTELKTEEQVFLNIYKQFNMLPIQNKARTGLVYEISDFNDFPVQTTYDPTETTQLVLTSNHEDPNNNYDTPIFNPEIKGIDEIKRMIKTTHRIYRQNAIRISPLPVIITENGTSHSVYAAQLFRIHPTQIMKIQEQINPKHPHYDIFEHLTHQNNIFRARKTIMQKVLGKQGNII